ncbi:MAG TPA: anhydro-N-acetylmuramic acid kinase, partial [Pseudorhodoferax sp.]|nr:anhydro-N-acetylmuramic acid kinase [Pseudorhodoferax sp.]
MRADRFIGLMSGTSLDGVDGVLAETAGTGLRVLAHASAPFDAALRAELLALNTRDGRDELHRAALAANGVALAYAGVVHGLLQHSGLDAQAVRAIGAHGQTVRHQPQAHDGVGYTLQLLNPSLLAERCGIAVVADLRSRDLAAGGQGAPLVPAFHQAQFGQRDAALAVLNLGGISNLSVLPPLGQDSAVLGFDCGPGNALLDLWCQRHRGQPYDADGAWAASGQVHAGLLAALRVEPYFALPPPKSTGRDLFHADWLAVRLAPFAD